MKKIVVVFLLIETLFANFYVKSIKVEKKEIRQERKYYGKIAFDEENISILALRVDGFVEEIHIASTFQKVKKGEMLFSVYSPELLQAQNEYLNALRFKSNILATKEKLRLLGVDEDVIKEITKNKKVLKNIPFFAKRGGIVLEKNISQGQYLKKGEQVYKFINLNRVWFVAQVPQEQIALLSMFKSARVKIIGMRDEIEAIFLQTIPLLSGKFVEVRFLLNNPNHKLFENFFGSITLFGEPKETLFVPKECVLLRDGKLYVFRKNQEGGFSPVEIEAKELLDGGYEILSGIEEGDEIAQNALFILDSDAQVNGEYE